MSNQKRYLKNMKKAEADLEKFLEKRKPKKCSNCGKADTKDHKCDGWSDAVRADLED